MPSTLPPLNGRVVDSVAATTNAKSVASETTLGCFCRANNLSGSNVILRQPGQPDTNDMDQVLYEGFTVIVTPAKATGSVA